MANKQLTDFLTAENPLDGNEDVYIAQGGKTRKTLLQKIKEFVIGTSSMGTTATDVTGAVAELKESVDLNTTQLNDIEQNKASKSNAEFTGTMTLNNKTIAIQDSITPTLLNNWGDGYGYPLTCSKSGNVVCITGFLSVGLATNDTTIFNLPDGFKPSIPVRVNICEATGKNGYVDILPDGNCNLSVPKDIISGDRVTININFKCK